jgi:hypothetical protein
MVIMFAAVALASALFEGVAGVSAMFSWWLGLVLGLDRYLARRSLKIPRSLLRDETDPEQVMWDVIEPMWSLGPPEKPDDRRAAASRGQQALHALHWLLYEVVTGGFDQFFVENTAVVAEDALAGARLVGATEYASIISEALEIFPGGRLIQDHRSRRKFMKRLSPEKKAKLEELYEQFYALLADENTSLAKYCADYVARHPTEFFSDS